MKWRGRGKQTGKKTRPFWRVKGLMYAVVRETAIYGGIPVT